MSSAARSTRPDRSKVLSTVAAVVAASLAVFGLTVAVGPGEGDFGIGAAAAQGDDPSGSTPSPEERGRLDLRGQTPSDESFAEAARRVHEYGSVPVVVGLPVLFEPEGYLSDDEASSQRAGFTRAREALFRDLEGTEFEVTQEFETVPFVGLQLSDHALTALGRSSRAATLTIDEVEEPLLAQSSPLIEADQLWSGGSEGEGFMVAVIDDGVDRDHPFLGGRVVEEACFSRSGVQTTSGPSVGICPNGQHEQIGSGSGVNCDLTDPFERRCDHGTHVAGIIGGEGPGLRGVAPKVDIMAVQAGTAFPDVQAVMFLTSDIIKGLERVLHVHQSGPRTIAAVNMSLGGGGYNAPCDDADSARKAVIDNLRSEGVATVVAAGNGYRTGVIAAPACISSAVAVGSTTKLDEVAPYSDNHPSMVDVLAPGSSIRSSVYGGNLGPKSGTSMAAPQVAGAWALMRSRHPDAGVDAILEAFKTTGKLITDHRLGGGYAHPRIQIKQASDALAQAGTRTLTVALDGTGQGSVTGDGIDCPDGDCTTLHEVGSTVVLEAVAAPGSTFEGWSADCAGSGGAAELAGSATSSESALTSSHTIALPDGISAADRLVVGFVRAGPAVDHAWPPGWSEVARIEVGDPSRPQLLEVRFRDVDGTEGFSGSDDSITVTTSGSVQGTRRSAHTAYRITSFDPAAAPFVSTHQGFTNSPAPPSLEHGPEQVDMLWLAVMGSLGRTVQAFPASYDGGVWQNTSNSQGDVHHAVAASAYRQLNASSEQPGPFTMNGSSRWAAATLAIQGAPDLGSDTCQVHMSSDRHLTANFSSPTPHHLEVGITGEGGVTGAGIDCPGDCATSYPPGTTVTLEASPAEDYAFHGWQGQCSGTEDCSFTTPTEGQSSLEVRAIFAGEGVKPLDITLEGAGEVMGGGLLCPPDCFGLYDEGSEVTLRAHPPAIPTNQTDQQNETTTTAYVTSSADGVVTPIDTATNNPGDPIDVSPFGEPGHVAVTPDGTAAYVVTQLSGVGGFLVPIDTTTNSPGDPIDLGLGVVGRGVAIAPDGTTAYVSALRTTSEDPFVEGVVVPVDLQAASAAEPIVVGDEPGSVVITPDGDTLYVLEGASSTLVPIDTATANVGSPIQPVDEEQWLARDMTMTSDGSTIYVLGGWEVLDEDGENIEEIFRVLVPIDTATNTPGNPIFLEAPFTAQQRVAVMPDGATAYVGGLLGVVPVDLVASTQGEVIDTGSAVTSIAVTPDGSALYLVDTVGNVVVPLDTATNTPGNPIAVPEFPLEIAIGERVQHGDAQPDPGYEWSGDCTGKGTCELIMDGPKHVVVTFSGFVADTTSLDVHVEGEGTVTGEEIECPDTCSATYPTGSELTLQAQAASGWVFTGWTGDCAGIDACQIVTDGVHAVGATFEAITHTLGVSLGGDGSGTVTGPGIDCPPGCSAEFEEGSEVALVASPAPGSTFSEWSGACGGSGDCHLTMDAAREVTAIFVQAPVPPSTGDCQLIRLRFALLGQVVNLQVCL